MEQIAEPTMTAQPPVEFNGGGTSQERLTGHHNGMSQGGMNPPQIPSATDAGQRARVAMAAFGEIVALLSFSPVFKHLSLADLEWLVLPALATQQVTVVRGKVKDQKDLMVPIALALWAHVSEDVDKKLEAQQQAHIPFRLAPQDWKSGEIPWLLMVLAPKEVAQALVKQLEKTVFKDKSFKRFAIGAVHTPSTNKAKETEEEGRLVQAQRN